MTTGQLRERLDTLIDTTTGINHRPSIRLAIDIVSDAITELEARDREIEQAKAREEAWRADIRARTYELSQAKAHAERLAEALDLLATEYRRLTGLDGAHDAELRGAEHRLATYREWTDTQEKT